MAEDDITPAPAYDAAAPDTGDSGPVVEKKRSGKAIGSLVCGIISLVILGVILGVVAVVLGAMARKEIKENPALAGDGMALAGIITGAIGAVLAVVLIALGAGVGL
ncbi:MAG TPA: DUF4190 domain-containing protein [Solirubrobacteraceae bacterium]|nr:DUF4190 domain-containing protein [Solirubrobacteraceae bacterium]